MKKTYLQITLLSVLILLHSCISNKKIAYFQYQNEYSEPETISKDTLIRKYRAGELSYRLQPNDLLDIKISTLTPSVYNPFNDADRSLVPGQMNSIQNYQQGVKTQGYYIDPEGYLELPLTGRIAVAGLTIKQAEDSVSEHVSEYLTDPVVRIKLLNFRFSVIGEVEREATLTSDDNYLTLIQALALAGGANEYGDLSRIKVIRHFPEETNVFYVNLLSEEFLTSPFYFVQPGDVIVVTPLKQRAYLKYVSPNLNIFTTSVSLLLTVFTLIKLL